MPNGSMIRLSHRPTEDAGGASFVFRGESFVLSEETAASQREVGYLRCRGSRYSICRVSAPPEPQPEAATGPVTVALTQRELQIVLMIAEGQCDKSIARALGTSSYTVREYVRRSCGKLGVARRTALASTVVGALSAATRED
jgi:DNA-binding NarL/FixJ family response regulator